MPAGVVDQLPLAEHQIERILRGGAERADLGVIVTLVEKDVLRHVFVNDAAAVLFGCTRDEFLARPYHESFTAESHEGIVALLQGSSDQSKLAPFEGEGVRLDGSHFPVEVALSRVLFEGKRYAVGFFSSVAARVAADAALVSSEARFRFLIESAPDGVVISRHGTVLYLNPAAVGLLGYDRAEELVGRPMSEFLDPEQINRMMTRLRTLGDGAKLAPMEYRARRKDGSLVIAEITSLPLEFGGAPAFIAFARDVTERVQMQEQLARTDRLASLGTLAAGVAHEVNNPLTFMALGIELVSRRIMASRLPSGEKEQILATLADVGRGADRVALVVRDLKTFSRVTEDEGHRVDVREVVDSAMRIVAHRSKHFAEVVSFVQSMPLVTANAARLEQVFVNLVLNAVQSFDEIRAGNRIELRAGLEGDRVFIEVEDNGPGIPATVIPRIFDPFFTTKPVGEGTGLGLAIVHGILHQMGGDITVRSVEGQGSTFRITLAIAPERSETTSSEVPRSDVVTRRSRVLVIDDEAEVARAMKRTLEPKHEVVSMTNPCDAAELLASGADFDAILCDLAMPELNGTELYREVVTARPELALRFIVVTGGAISARMQGFLDSWTGPRLEKPFSRRELEETIAEVVGLKERIALG